jgi:hypothetical protein
VNELRELIEATTELVGVIRKLHDRVAALEKRN